MISIMIMIMITIMMTITVHNNNITNMIVDSATNMGIITLSQKGFKYNVNTVKPKPK